MATDPTIVHVGGMSESPYGSDTVKLIQQEHLGDYTTLFVGPWTPEKIKAVGDFCRQHRMHFVMDEMINRLTGKISDSYAPFKEGILKALADYPDCCDGTLIMCEYGGLMFYWPHSTVKDSQTLPPPATDFREAASHTESQMKAVLAYAQEQGLKPPFVCIEACGQASSFLYRAGMDRVDLEVIYNSELERSYAALKGSALAFGKQAFGVDMAMVWYGGNQHDGLWGKRWRTSLFQAFIRGANPIYAEHGLMNYHALGKNYDMDHPEVRRFRTVLGDLADFAAKHPRPTGFPLAAVAVVGGRLDGFTGAGQTHLWGQRTHEAFRLGAPDRSWELFECLYQRRPWESRNRFGDTDYSGNPPLGQADIIPFDAPQALFNRYRVLMFLGRNSMNEELYAKLLAFVRQGGQLLMTAAHLNTSCQPGDTDYLPYHDGHWEDLFGVTLQSRNTERLPYGIKFKQEPSCHWRLPLWSPNCDPKFTDGGFATAHLQPTDAEVIAVASDRFCDGEWTDDQQGIIFSKAHGKGCAVLVNSLDYPGADGLKKLYRLLMEASCEAVTDYPHVECTDRVRYAVYQTSAGLTAYFLNTEEHLHQEVLVRTSSDSQLTFTLSPGEIREFALTQDSIQAP